MGWVCSNRTYGSFVFIVDHFEVMRSILKTGPNFRDHLFITLTITKCSGLNASLKMKMLDFTSLSGASKR